MKQSELTIRNPTGLHARPAKVLVNLAKQFKSDIRIQSGEKKVNAKSMVSVLTLGATQGTQIILSAEGEDETQALAQIEAAILSGLGDNEAPAAPPPAPTPAPVVAPAPVVKRSDPPNLLRSVAAAPGIAIGPAFLYQAAEIDLGDPGLHAGKTENDLQQARHQARLQLHDLHQQMLQRKLKAEAGIFEAHIELMDDPELLESVQESVSGGSSVVRAWMDAVEGRASTLAALSDPLLAARADDLRDVGKRVLRLLLGLSQEGSQLPDEPVVLLARELSPSETAAFDTQRVLGFAIVNGGPTSHIAILARALGLPAIVSAPESILALAENTTLVLDGNQGTLLVAPSDAALEQAQQERERWLEGRRLAQSQATLPARMLDGRVVDVTANAGSPADAARAVKMGADGIGLLRTEFLFLERTTAPSEDEQEQVYRTIAQTMGPLPVIVRTLDIGGDKPLPYIQLRPEQNPFLGERGIRLCLNRPELFREQLRAILRAAAFGSLRIMFPMVSDIDEWRQARSMVESLRLEMAAPAVQMGIMIEVPSAALQAESFAPEVDFFSIGTNDLTQYTLALDRGHPALAAKHDGLHPAVLKLIAMTINAAHKYGKRADICGELGSDPAAIPLLLGLGMDELSVSIPSIPAVKAQVRTLRMLDLQPLAQQALTCSSAFEVRQLVQAHFHKGASA